MRVRESVWLAGLCGEVRGLGGLSERSGAGVFMC